MKLFALATASLLLAFGSSSTIEQVPEVTTVVELSPPQLRDFASESPVAVDDAHRCCWAAECGTITIDLTLLKNGDIEVFMGVMDEVSGEAGSTMDVQYPKNTSPVRVLIGSCAWAVWPCGEGSYTWQDVYDAHDPCELLCWSCHCD